MEAGLGLHPWLDIEPAKTITDIAAKLRGVVFNTLGKKGAVVAVSGGIDSSLCAALCATALGNNRVFGLLLPERDSSPQALERGNILCRHLRISPVEMDIEPTLSAIGCYRWRDEAIRSVFPDYGKDWKSKIVIDQDLLHKRRYDLFHLVVQTPDGVAMKKRLPLTAYLQIVAATNFKQRIRKTIEYFHADRLDYAVIGTPNRLEYDQGFFVKNGDGAADVKPIAHLYKSQVYALARWLGLPEEITSAMPTTDTYSMPQTQSEFFFVLPYETMDLVLYGLNNGKTAEEVAAQTDLTSEQVERVFANIRSKRRATRILHLRPILLDDVREVGEPFDE